MSGWPTLVQEKHVPAGFYPVNSPVMAQRQTKAERLLTKRPSRALHSFGNLLDRRLASRV
jgi:hypothetical protein